MADLLIKNGMVLLEQELVKADILVKDGQIAALGTKLEAKDVNIVDAAGKLVAPGLIDVHVHFRDPGYTEKETLTTGANSAAAGGYTTVAAMPNLNPTPDTPQQVAKMVKRNAAECCVRVLQYAAITKERTSDELVDFAGCKKAGAFAFSNDGNGVQTARTMLEAMSACAKNNIILAAHVEDDSLAAGGVINEGVTSKKLGVNGINAVSESSQLARDLLLAQATGVHYHVCHISTKESVELVRWAKQQGINVTSEVSPHHLLLNNEDITGLDGNFKMNPPLRSKADQQALIAGLVDGTIDLIATDHAPHTEIQKQGDINHACFGITGLETAFDLLYSRLVRTNKLSLVSLLHAMSTTPAKVFGLHDCGEIQLAKRADLTLIDLNAPHVVSAHFQSLGKNTPFIGAHVNSQVLATICGGEIVFSCNGKG